MTPKYLKLFSFSVFKQSSNLDFRIIAATNYIWTNQQIEVEITSLQLKHDETNLFNI